VSKQLPFEKEESLLKISKEICLKEGIDFHTLDSNQIRGLTHYWCSNCSKTFPLWRIRIEKRKKICGRCNNGVKLHANSNKFGKIRRMIFFRHIEYLED
jgi:DNA-directed RNA polymerase subunit RPC12/RpoP